MDTDFRELANILSVIATPPGLRTKRRDGDLPGAFDKWFDGGAIKVITGWDEYHFDNGAVAVVPSTATLRVDIRLPGGGFVIIYKQAQAPPYFPIGAD
jgi:hypothetical protein